MSIRSILLASLCVMTACAAQLSPGGGNGGGGTSGGGNSGGGDTGGSNGGGGNTGSGGGGTRRHDRDELPHADRAEVLRRGVPVPGELPDRRGRDVRPALRRLVVRVRLGRRGV